MVVRQQVLRPGFWRVWSWGGGGGGWLILMLFTCTIIIKKIMNENKNRHRVHLFACVYMLNSNILTQIKGLMDTYRMLLPLPLPPVFTPPPSVLSWHSSGTMQTCHNVASRHNSVYNHRMGNVTYLKSTQSVSTLIFFF